MASKLHRYSNPEGLPGEQLWFNCPGCECAHGFTVGSSVPGRNWQWNGSMDKPTFTPSLLCNKDYPESRCHSFVTDGKIQFLSDCYHGLAGQTVEIPDWD